MQTVFVALITPDPESGFIASVPDLSSCVTSGATLRDALVNIDDALNLCLTGMEDLGLVLPTPRALDAIDVPAGSVPTLVNIDTVEFRIKTDQRSVRKNISIPAWMAYKADRMNVNLSRVTQTALQSLFDNPIPVT